MAALGQVLIHCCKRKVIPSTPSRARGLVLFAQFSF